MDVSDKRFVVVGMGKSGMAVARLLLQRGGRVVLNDRRPADELGTELDGLVEAGAELALGHHDADVLSSADHIVVSPGVPPLPALDTAEAAGVPIASEVEVASWFMRSTFVGITGTNGKSTVTSLVGEMLKRSGKSTFVGGNLGTPLIDAVGTEAAAPGGYAVVELSSFQLERVDRLRVNVAALLNLSPDHLDRYASYADYQAAKARIFEGQLPEDAALLPADDAQCQTLAQAGRARRHGFGAPDGEVRVVDGAIHDVHSGLRVSLDSLRLQGTHNVQNACAAALAARLAGATVEAIATTLADFAGLPHRMELVRELDGVRYLNDSKATNVGAAAAALAGLAEGGGRVVLIAGGVHKGSDYGPVAQWMARHGRAAILIGEAAPLIRQALSTTGLSLSDAGSMLEAVVRARQLTRPGDAVLLAPACSSFDMFRSYAHRGEAFQQAVRGLPGGG